MKIDDLIGILFLLFFIVGPALRGLLKPREPLIEVELPPEIEEMMREPEPRPTEPQPPARPGTARAGSRPAQPQAAPAPSAPAPGGTMQTAEGHAAGSRSRQRIEEARRDATDVAAEEHAAFAVRQGHKMKHAGLPLHARGIVHGMLWHEVLSEPASRKLQRARMRRRKLLS